MKTYTFAYANSRISVRANNIFSAEWIAGVYGRLTLISITK